MDNEQRELVERARMLWDTNTADRQALGCVIEALEAALPAQGAVWVCDKCGKAGTGDPHHSDCLYGGRAPASAPAVSGEAHVCVACDRTDYHRHTDLLPFPIQSVPASELRQQAPAVSGEAEHQAFLLDEEADLTERSMGMAFERGPRLAAALRAGARALRQPQVTEEALSIIEDIENQYAGDERLMGLCAALTAAINGKG